MTLRGPSQEEYVCRECQSTLFAATVLSARARQMLSRGCIDFLVTVEEVPTAAPGLKDIPIAREIPGVSPPELMMMPPVREIELLFCEACIYSESYSRGMCSDSVRDTVEAL